jgi:short-subunit dehydrogenase
LLCENILASGKGFMKSKGILIIAGAGRGLGRTLALLGIAEGYQIAAIARSEADLRSLQNDCKNCNFMTYAADLADENDVERAVSLIASKGFIRGLINCAATWTGGREVRELTVADYRKSFDMNFYVALNPILAVLSATKSRSLHDDLAIVSIGATASLRGGIKSSSFATAKSALRILSQSLSKELGPSGVHVAHVILDGLIDNPRTRQLNPGLAEERFMNPETIAKAIINLIEQPRDSWMRISAKPVTCFGASRSPVSAQAGQRC